MENNSWSVLAQFMKKGNKNGALQLCRLVGGTLESKAYSLQLEGDVLMAFCDSAALARYRAASELYRHAGYSELAEAVLVGANIQADADPPVTQRLK